VADINVRLGGDNSGFRGMLDEAESAAGKFGRSVSALIPALSGAAIAGFFRTVIAEAGALQDLSDRLNVSTDSLQSFNAAVRLAGGTNEQATQAWDKARKAIDSLVAGTPEAVKQFEKLGLSAKDFIGLNLDESLEKIARGYKDNADVAGAYDAITDILGSKSAPRLMAALLQLANEGFPGLTASMKQSMQVMDSEVIAKLDEFGDRMGQFWNSIKVGGSSVLGVLMAIGNVLCFLAAGSVALVKGEGFFSGASGVWGEKAAASVKKVTTELDVALAAVEREAKAEAEAGKAREKMVKENEEAAEKAMKAKKAEEEQADKLNAKKNAAVQKLYDAESKLVEKAMERAKAEGKVTSAMEDQLSAIQKMGGAGQGGFKAGAGGGGEGKVSVDAIANALENAKKAFEFIVKNPNAPDYARDYIQTQALIDQMTKNLAWAQGQQGIGTPIEVNISGLDFTALSKFSDAAFGSKEQVSLDRQILAVMKETKLSTDEIKARVKNINDELLG